ncbi:hypothetical protein JVU11DRAFT_10563 [Chiua virens]|nr:hypothetical protein JVU11DRAFT_10563 [Chiua virens]
MCTISLDDDALDTLTKQWPKLTQLSLDKSLLWGVELRVTYRVLATLLFRCTALVYFADAKSRPQSKLARDSANVVTG